MNAPSPSGCHQRWRSSQVSRTGLRLAFFGDGGFCDIDNLVIYFGTTGWVVAALLVPPGLSVW